jgi:hypothetical protein
LPGPFVGFFMSVKNISFNLKVMKSVHLVHFYKKVKARHPVACEFSWHKQYEIKYLSKVIGLEAKPV